MPRLSEGDTLTFECHDTVIRVRSGDEEVLTHLLGRLPPGAGASRARWPDVSYRLWRTGRDAAGHPSYLVSVRHGAERECHDLASVMDAREVAALVADDFEFRIALHSPRVLFVHAAVVAWAGRAIAVPGRTFAGKSTLAAALVRAGATYCSDEFAVLDEDGLVRPFARALHLRGRHGEPSRDVRPEELGGAAASEPLPLGLVVATSFRAGARWRPRPMSPGRTALALLANTVVARRRPDHAMALIARAVELGAAGVCGPRGEAEEMVADVLRLASDPPGAGHSVGRGASRDVQLVR